MTLAEIARDRRRHGRRRDAGDVRRDRPAVVDSRRGPARRAVRRRRRRAGRRPRLRRGRPSAAGAVAVLVAAAGRRCRTCWSTTRWPRSAGSPAPVSTGSGRRPGRRRRHRLVGQDQHQGPARRRARAARADRRAGGSLNNEIGVPLTALVADDGDPAPGPRDGRPRGRPHRLPVRGRAAADRRGAQRRRRARRRVRRRRRPPPGPRASWSRRCRRPPTAGSRCSTPTTRWSRAMAGVTPARVVTFGSRPDADVRAERRAARRRSGGRRSLLRAGDREPVEVHPAAARRAPRRQRAGRRRRRARARATPVERGRRALATADPAQPVADGGRRAARRRHRRQRRLQRQPRLDAGRAGARWSRWRGGRRTWAVLGEMLELGAASAAEHERGRADWRAGSGVDAPASSWARAHGRARRRASPRAPSTERGRVVVADVRRRARAARAPSCARATSCWSRPRAAAGLERSPRRCSARGAARHETGPARGVPRPDRRRCSARRSRSGCWSAAATAS